jgi:hypothetical protein
MKKVPQQKQISQLITLERFQHVPKHWEATQFQKGPRRTTTVTRIDNQQDAKMVDAYQASEERVQLTTSGAYPSQKKRKIM